ncbi:GH22016 [Drosophila grimshawi]|uniref:GH22016 n=1 Tax=Drosophila grimshawi TaxID=7222 RepID=B4J9H9_DROGR|nr:GH22016 [Drosophila grimshawi]
MVSQCMERHKASWRLQVEDVEKRSEDLNWLEEVCKESSVHGMPYVARRDLHGLERIFWLAMVIGAAYYAGSTCYSQWERYRNHPIVYVYEYLFALRSFSLVGVTVCTRFIQLNKTDKLINDIWGVDAAVDIKKAEYYHSFLNVLNHLDYRNLDTLMPYVNDTSLKHINFVDILLSLQEDIMPNPNDQPVDYVPTLTEMGLCQTTTQLSHLGNPYGESKELTGPKVRICDSFANCQITFKPPIDETLVFLYLHDIYEVMLPHDRRTVVFHMGTEYSYVLKVLLNPISAEEDVRQVPIAYRKCRYKDENYLKYFSDYSPSLCRLECRIKVALKLCNCKPFFYAVPINERTCNIEDMICLTQHKWLDKPCDCQPLCRENTYIITEKQGQSGNGEQYAGANFERTIIIQLDLPKMGMKRRVVFSTDQLLMSLGGAIGLFLGASFMTVFGLIQLVLYYLVVKCKCQRPKKQPIKSV